MASILTLAADAVTTELNTKLTSWGYSTTTATRKNLAKFVLEESGTLQVSVVGTTAPVETASRTQLRWTPSVDVILHKRTADDTDAEDDMLEFAETVASHFLQSFANQYHKVMSVESGVTEPTKEMLELGLFAVTVRLILQSHSSGEAA